MTLLAKKCADYYNDNEYENDNGDYDKDVKDKEKYSTSERGADYDNDNGNGNGDDDDSDKDHLNSTSQRSAAILTFSIYILTHCYQKVNNLSRVKWLRQTK